VFASRGHRGPVRSIASITQEGEEEIICITVEAQDRLYVTENYLVTHNSSLSDKIIAATQRQYPDGQVVKIDVEGCHESVWSGKLGVDNSRLLVAQPETGEHALDMADALIRTKEVSLIVVDSLAQLVPAKEIEASAEDQFVGLQSRMIGSFVRKAVNALLAERHRGHYITLLFINQFRSKIGGWSPTGDPLTEPGGKGLGFAYSLEITMKNKETQGKDDVGVDAMIENEHSFSITKNKLNAGPRSGEFRLRRMADPTTGLEEGEIDDAGTMLAYAKKFGIFTGGGSSWTLEFWDFSQKFKSAAEATKYLYENRDDYWLLRNYLISEQAGRLGMPQSFIERFYPE
jgi:recombination protein RecA